MNPLHLSIVIPAYNEAERIISTIRAIASYLGTREYSSEIIVVLNNCTDATLFVVEDLEKEILFLRHIDLGMVDHSSGTKGLAVKTGILAALGEYCMYVDADGSAPITELEKLWPYIQNGFDVVFGSRYVSGSRAHVSWYRRLLSRAANGIVQIVLLPGIHDTQCAFKLFTAASAKTIFSRIRIAGWGFDMEALFLARCFDFRIQEVPIVWNEVGGSSVKPKAFFTAFKDLVSIRTRGLK